MAYLFSFWAKTPASGFSVMTILGVISGKNIKLFEVTLVYFKTKRLLRVWLSNSIFLMIGLLATTAVWICLGFKSFSNPVVDYIGYSVKYLFMFIPTFNFGRAIMAIAQVLIIVPRQLCLETT